MLTASEFFDLSECTFREIFSDDEGVWTALDRLPGYLESCFKDRWPLAGITGLVREPLVILDGKVHRDFEVRAQGPKGRIQAVRNGEVMADAAIVLAGAYLNDDRVWLAPGAVVESGALIKGPTVVGDGTEIRQGAYMRGFCLVGRKCVVGHATEIKGTVMMDGAKAGHFAYLGDSILGLGVNLGAGTKLANLRMIPGQVVIRSGKEKIKTGRRKLGAILGDGIETGCNSVTSPGTLLGPKSVVYPNTTAPPGFYPAKTIIAPPRGTPVVRTPTPSGR